MTARPPSRSASATHSRQTSKAAVSATSVARAHSPRPSAIHLERKPSISTYPHAHNRQASVVNGGIQHSRNTSSVTPPITSPLSPQVMSDLATGQITIPHYIQSPPLPLNSMNGFDTSQIQLPTPMDMSKPPSSEIHRSNPGHSKSKSHQHTQSHPQSNEPKTPAEYALHILFTQFVRLAEAKINSCLNQALDVEPNVEAICGAGVDPAFDKIIGSLGYIARHKPRPVIDSVMFWRKSKSEAANVARSELKQQQQHQGRMTPVITSQARSGEAFSSLIRRNTEGVGGDAYSTMLNSSAYTIQAHSRENSAIADRRSTVAIYILCRVLIEVIGQTTLESITEEMADKLEDIIFNQLRSADPEILASSPLRMGNWTLFAQLLGVMSEIHFESVTDRLFLSDLEKTGKGFITKEMEPKVELVIRGMSYLKVKLYPVNAFEAACEFIDLLTSLFLTAQSQRIKHAYCDLYMKLILPIAARGETELNMPCWTKIVKELYPKLVEMCTRQKQWDIAFPLLGTIVCSTPWDFFSATWLQLLENNAPRLKDRSLRIMIVQTAARLVWTYLFRCSDTLNVTIKKLETVIRLFFPTGKRSLLLGADQDLMEAYIQLIRFIGNKHQDFCFRNIISPLLNTDQILATTSCAIELLSPERMIVGIKSFLAIMNDLEKPDEKPPFPIKFESSSSDPEPPISTWLKKFDSEKTEAMKKLDRMSRPVQLEKLTSAAKEYYETFGEVLGRILWVCDSVFGGKALLEEKFNPSQPKTPVAASFSFNNDHLPDQKQTFFDLLYIAFTALPRCHPPNITLTKMVEILCHGTAHVDQKVANGAANALKCIARQSNQRQKVIIGFARFIFDFDSRYATTSDAGMLGTAHIENTLKLYVELLRIWIEAIKQKTKIGPMHLNEDLGLVKDDSASRMDDLEISNVRAVVDEIEAHGLFFLSSCSRIVRKFALMVLNLITEFDNALMEGVEGKDSATLGVRSSSISESQQFTRIIHILEQDSLNVMNQNINDDKWSVADRSRLRRELYEMKSQNALVQLAISDNQYDSSLWFKLFPKLIRVCFERFPLTVVQCRDTVCGRLVQMQNQIQATAFEQNTRTTPEQRPGTRTSSSTEGIINQWKIYLIVACSTLTLTQQEVRPDTLNSQHSRKTSKGTQSSNTSLITSSKIISGRQVFGMVIQLLISDNQTIRDAVVSGLGSININLYKTLLEQLQPIVLRWNEPSQQRTQRNAPTSVSTKRSKRQDRLRTEITHVLQLTSHFMEQPEVYGDSWIVQHQVAFVKEMKTFLSEPDIKHDSDFVRLRRYFCGLVEELYEGISRTQLPERWLPFDGRRSLFNLIEQWCGQNTNANYQVNTTASIEIEKNDLKTAALSAMAALCAGPVMKIIENKSTVTFDIFALFQWVEYVFNESSDRLHRIGRKALKNLLMHNRDMHSLMGLAMKQCYLYRKNAKGVESYFAVVSDILTNEPGYPCGSYQSLALALFKIGDENHKVRTKSAALLRVTEERYFKTTTVLDYEVSIADKTAAVYKRAQFELSRNMAVAHAELAFYMVSEFTMYFNLVDATAQRDILAVLLPWLQMIELQQDPHGAPSPWSYMVLANLFEITVKFSSKIHNEVEGFWKALGSAPYSGNVKVVLDFIIAQSLERKEQNFVNYGKQIIVCLSGTPNGAKLVEALMAYLQPKLMSINPVEPYAIPDKSLFPYMADLSDSLPLGGKQHGFSRGHLGLILMVDLLVGPVPEMVSNLPLLLQAVFVLWDHYVPLVQEQAREMLSHLIHELIISKMINTESTSEKRAVTREFVETIRGRKPKTLWAYDDTGSSAEGSSRIPDSMSQMVKNVLEIFEADFPHLKAQWGKIALQWATNCPVRHLACRSFQVFRCLLTTLDQNMLADMLARLSNTIADNSGDIQSFSMEILITLNSITSCLSSEELLMFPQLFWATVACLYTIHEKEFMEVLLLLQKLLDKIDLGNPQHVGHLLSMYPANWEGKFDGIQSLIVKGMRSSVSIDRTLDVLSKMATLPSNELIGESNRLLFSVLANLPRLLEGADGKELGPPKDTIIAAENLLIMCRAENEPEFARIMSLYAAQRFRSKDSFKSQIVSAIRESYFPAWEQPALIFLVGMLSNNLKWFKLRVMEFLTAILPLIDLRKPEFAGMGADLISPLLRLLQTEYCQQALDVLDKVILISGGKMDRQVMRMSMGNRTLRKEYERTETLFGIPEDSGWAIPMPAIMASNTRANVHAVFYTCQIPSPPKDNNPAPDLQFQVEDYIYTSFADRTATMLSEDARGEGGLGDMVVRLENLDSFFADEAFNHSHNHATDTESVQDYSAESAPQLYDSRVYAILNQSLHRSTSVTSFKNSFGDSLSTPAPRDPQTSIMTPTIFSAPPLPVTGRGGVPNRAGMTSPEYGQIYRPSSDSSTDSDYQGDASDDDDEPSNGARYSKDDSPFNLENLLKTAGQKAKTGMENVRNLRRNREREKEEAAASAAATMNMSIGRVTTSGDEALGRQSPKPVRSITPKFSSKKPGSDSSFNERVATAM